MLIYLLSCKVCGLQYVDSTTNKFRFRWNNYKGKNWKAKRGEDHMQPLVFEHFSSNYHNNFLEDCSVTLIDKTDGADPTRREDYWRWVLETVVPYVLNMVDWLFYLRNLWTLARFYVFFEQRCLCCKINTSNTTYFITSISFFFGPLALAGRVLWNRVHLSVLLSVCPSISL